MDSNETVRSVTPKLADPVEYVRGMLGSMLGLSKEPNALVRIGQTGSGHSPHYRVELDGKVLACFDGRNHQQIFRDDALVDENWSKATMTTNEVRQLLGELREAKKR